MSATTDLTALVGSRICHDLINPLGAISNGVELLSMSPGTDGPEMQLIAASVANANARIQFFRTAFGSGGSHQPMGSGEVKRILNDLSATSRQKITWLGSSDEPRNRIRLIFLLIQCCETTLPLGGDLTISGGADHWVLVAQSGRLADLDSLWDCVALNTGCDAVEAAHVHFPLAAQVAREEHAHITLHRNADSLKVTVLFQQAGAPADNR